MSTQHIERVQRWKLEFVLGYGWNIRQVGGAFLPSRTEIEVVPASALAEQKQQLAQGMPDVSPGDVIAAEPDGTIVLDDGITTWNPARACAFLLADDQKERDEEKQRTTIWRKDCEAAREDLQAAEKQLADLYKQVGGVVDELERLAEKFLAAKALITAPQQQEGRVLGCPVCEEETERDSGTGVFEQEGKG
jgi:hypothetical protein